MERTRAQGCVSDLRLDRMMAGELAEEDARSARGHIDGCAMCAARLAEVEADRASFRAAPPALALPAGAVSAAAREPAWVRLRRWLWPATAVLAAAAALLVWRVAGRGAGNGGDTTRLKGRDHLGFYVKRGDAVARGAGGEVLRPGDTVRFTYTAQQRGYLAIASVDGAGQVSVYHADGERAAAIEPGEDAALPGGVELDAVLGAETVYGFFCRAPVAVGAVRAAVAGGHVELEGCVVDRLTWEKRAP
ncbi:MAG TPA: hypothetical protein VMZ28_12195 [Kofleriaceae bacterium]|nr:hypothetical protein [Kofleriaceae bacterium]